MITEMSGKFITNERKLIKRIFINKRKKNLRVTKIELFHRFFRVVQLIVCSNYLIKHTKFKVQVHA